ncbi:MAG TPA: porin family protein [Cyclobacteriaceae bacterium]|nr:PorT family protein [Cyclobacteriaceae bacterium]HRK55523.1 porin family protein [Cyclobacteriaceae bacterium]
MKKLILYGLLMSFSIIANAQWKFNFVGGPNLANFNGSEKKDWGGTETDPKIVIRFHLGFTGERLISEKWMGGAGLQFSTKGASYTGDVDFYNMTTFELEKLSVRYNKVLSYIDIPIYLKYIASEKVDILMGLQPSILMSAKIKNDDNAIKAFPSLPKKEDAKDYYNSIDGAIIIGPQYKINEKIALQLLYKYGFIKIAKYSEYDYTSNSDTEKKYKVGNSVFAFAVSYNLK